MYDLSLTRGVPLGRIELLSDWQNRTSVEMTINSELLPNTVTIAIGNRNRFNVSIIVIVISGYVISSL